MYSNSAFVGTRVGYIANSLFQGKILNQINRFFLRKTFASGQFMRGTDPIKSTWVYLKLIL